MEADEIARRVQSMQISSSNKKDPIIIPEDLASTGKNRLDSCLVCKSKRKLLKERLFVSKCPVYYKRRNPFRSKLLV